MTNIVFTYGCNWRCRYCFQKDLLRKPDKVMTMQDVFKHLLHDKDKFGITSVEIIGGEPTLYSDLPYFVKELYTLGFDIMIATNGSNPDIAERCLPFTQLFAIDYKTTFDKYDELVCYPFNKDNYINTVEIAKRKDYIVRTTYLKGYHDKLLKRMAKELCEFTDIEHYRVQQGLYQNTLDPSFKFEDSTEIEAKEIEMTIKKEMEAICEITLHKSI